MLLYCMMNDTILMCSFWWKALPTWKEWLLKMVFKLWWVDQLNKNGLASLTSDTIEPVTLSLILEWEHSFLLDKNELARVYVIPKVDIKISDLLYLARTKRDREGKEKHK